MGGRIVVMDLGNGWKIKMDVGGGNESPHVHICHGSDSVQYFFLSDLVCGEIFNIKQLRPVVEYLRSEQELLIEHWEDIHGQINR